MKKTVWLWLAVLLSMLLVLGGCNQEGIPSETDAVTDAPVPEVIFAAGGVTQYSVVRGDMCTPGETAAAVRVSQYIRGCGLDISIMTDWKDNPVSEYEIVVGTTNRADEGGRGLDAHSVGEEGYYVYVSGSRIYIGGGSDEAIMQGAEAFLSRFFGYTGDAEKCSPVTDVAIPGDYAEIVSQQYVLKDVSVGGKSLRDFAIRVLNRENTEAAETAEELQSTLYKECGIWMPILKADENWDGPAVIFSPDAPSVKGCAELIAEGGNLVFRSDLAGGFDGCFRRFFNEKISGAEGTVTLDAGYRYEMKVGSVILYSDFGAVGDGVTDDFAAIRAAHTFANANGLPVKADKGKTFLIGLSPIPAYIETDTDWSEATLIFDDREADTVNGGTDFVFQVRSTLPAYALLQKLPAAFTRDTEKFNVQLTTDCLVALTQSGTKRYIRFGANANSGSEQQEVILLRRDGTLDADNGLIWDYTALTGATAYPIDEKTLTLKCGTIITRAPLIEDHSGYFKRGIGVERSNVKITGLVHKVEGEEIPRIPVSGILIFNNCANITVEDCVFTGRRRTEQGSYDISASRTANLTFKNCSQTNSIYDSNYWGVMGSNFCKNITLDGCTFSRFDAHQGVRNVTIRGCTLGHQGLNAIGFGTLLIENSTVAAYSFINLRSDYGSTWEGDVVIRNCVFRPYNGAARSGYVSLINGSYTGFHDFGYTCYMPKTVTIEGLKIEDGKSGASFGGINLFANMTSAWTSEAYEAKIAAEGYPYQLTEKVIISGYESEQNKPWRVSSNMYMFRNVEIVDLDRENGES